MRKSVLFILLLFFCMAGKADVVVKEVSTAQEFVNAINANPSAYIKLKCDIYLTSTQTIEKTFSGTIDGEGKKTINGKEETVYYSLYGDSGDGRVKNPIFKKIEGATLKNLLIRNFRIEWDDDDIGAVAYTAKNCSFNNVIVSEVSIFNDDDEAGAIVGKAENCDFRNVRGMGNDVTVDGTHAGGFVGISYNSVYCNCSNSAYSTVYADGSWGNAYAGGFVGESKSDQFVFCVNFASVGALDDRIGGVTGYATKSFFTNCTNSGAVMHCTEKVFLDHTSGMKSALEEEIKKNYDKQDFDLSAGFISFIGTIGLSAAAFGVELCLLTFASAGVGAFALTIIVAATGITVTLINLIDAEIGAHDEMGGICGTCDGSVFDACSNYGRLMCRDCYVGGIVGLMRDMPTASKITNCLNAGHIQGYELVGGIFGECQPAHVVTHCLNVGEVSVPSDGQKDQIGNVSGNYSDNLSKNYYKAATYDDKAEKRIPVTAEQLSNGIVAGWLNDGATGENALWRQTIGTDEYPMLDPSHEAVNPQKYENVFAIFSVEDLDALRTAVNSGTKDSYIVYIENDIDCSGITWNPIGTSTKPFSGICYGNGHTISNLKTTDDKNNNGVGFFGVVGINTEVHNLFIGSGSIVGGNGVGAIIGYCDHQAQTDGYIKIEGCGNAATITGNYDCGGIIGAIYSDHKMQLTLDNCYNMGAITGTTNAAAICGYGKQNATVTSCWNSGTVTGYEANKGFVRADNDATLTIRNCYNAENLTGLFQTDIISFSDEDLKNGTLCYKLNGSNDASVGLPWEQNLTLTTNLVRPVYKGYSEDKKAVYTNRTINNEYGTVVLPYNVKSNEYIKYYTLADVINAEVTQLHFHIVDELPAGTPAIFRILEMGDYEFISSSNEFSYELKDITIGDWTMTGNLDVNNKEFKNTTELKSLYYISGGQIKSATNSLTIAPFRAYIKGPSRDSDNTAKVLNVSFDDGSETTSIQFIPVETKDNVTTYGIFNLAGQRLNAPTRGINIINGKKVILQP